MKSQSAVIRSRAENASPARTEGFLLAGILTTRREVPRRLRGDTAFLSAFTVRIK